MLLLVDKPKGITSHDVIDRLRKITGIRKIGHAGTLDPNATGLLIVGIGRESTKKLGDLTKRTQKVYIADIFLGETRDTDDIEGKITSKNKNNKEFSVKEVNDVVKKFVGDIEQTPPMYSAIKVKGKKLYELARKGKKIEIEPRKVTIHSIKVLKYKYPDLKIKCKVSSGTYIRALTRDIGKELGCGAYLKGLRRTKIGEYSIKKAVELQKLTPENWRSVAV